MTRGKPTYYRPVRGATRRKKGRSPVLLLALITLWCLVLGAGLAQAMIAPTSSSDRADSLSWVSPAEPAVIKTTDSLVSQSTATPAPIGTTDPVPANFQLGQELYLENCATCHLGLPPGVFPSETWRQLLQDPQHYGTTLSKLPQGPELQLIWNYLRQFSRSQPAEEDPAFRLTDSRYFRALHPRVKLPRPVTMGSCITCHPLAAQFNFRSLTPEWENAP